MRRADGKPFVSARGFMKKLRCERGDSNLSCSAGLSGAEACKRNPERSRKDLPEAVLLLDKLNHPNMEAAEA
jgi:hypothetical protein